MQQNPGDDTFIQYVENVNINVSENISIHLKVGAILFGSYIPPTRFIMIRQTSVPLQVCSHLLIAITWLLVEEI